MKERLEGYKKALIDANITVSDERIKMLSFTHEKEDILVAIKQLLTDINSRVEAILFTTSKLGVMGLECIHSLGFHIPDDVAVVSFDDPDAYKISNPPISAIAQPLKKLGMF